MYYKVTSSELPAPQLLRVLQLYYKVTSAHLPAPQILHASRLHFAHSTRTISAEGCAGIRQIALSPAFRALHTHDLRRGLRGQPANRTLACISRTRHARSPQRVARVPGESHSRLHFAHSTRTISAEGCAGTRQMALWPAFRALDTHDLRRGLRGHPANRTLACISRTRHARSPQRVARAPSKSHSRLHFAHSTRTISAEGCAHSRQIALSPAFRALDTHDLRRGLRAQPANRTLACISRTRHARSPQRVALSVDAVRPALRLEKRIYKVAKCFFIRTSPVLVFQYSHLPTHCVLACSLHACVPILTLRACRVSVCMCKCQCRSVSVCSANVVEVSVCKRKCRSVSVQGIFRKNPSQCFRELEKLAANRHCSENTWSTPLHSFELVACVMMTGITEPDKPRQTCQKQWFLQVPGSQSHTARFRNNIENQEVRNTCCFSTSQISGLRSGRPTSKRTFSASIWKHQFQPL